MITNETLVLITVNFLFSFGICLIAITPKLLKLDMGKLFWALYGVTISTLLVIAFNIHLIKG